MGTKKILVVEDERIVAIDIQQRLQGMGYTVSAIASSGSEAIRKAEEHRPDLVLMDIVIKGKMDGIETAGEMIRRFDLPVVYITAYSDDETLRRAKISGPFGYIIKPFDDRQLQVNIEMAVHKYASDKALRESEERFRRLAEASSEGILIHDGGIAIDANERLTNMLGYGLQELRGRDIYELVLPDRREEISGKALSGSEDPFEVSLRRKDGTTFPAEMVERGIPYEGLTVRVAAIRDITIRKQVETLMKERARSELYGFVVSALPLIAPGALQEVRADLLKIFAERFEEFFKPGFDEQMRRRGIESRSAGEDALGPYIGWVAELFSNFGIKVETSFRDGRGIVEFQSCPWIDYARRNPVFCHLCRAMASRSFSWVSPRGATGLNSTAAGGRARCRIEFKPAPADG
jgi:PAS domain S-box-containing protein